jgi:hypothetical protein
MKQNILQIAFLDSTEDLTRSFSLKVDPPHIQSIRTLIVLLKLWSGMLSRPGYSRGVLQKLLSYTILIFRQVAILQKKIGGKLFIFQQE